MKKGCIVALIVAGVVALLAIIAVVIGVVVAGKKLGEGGLEFLSKAPNAGAAFALETAIEEYRRQNPDAQVAATNEAWAEVLKDYKMGGATDMSQFVKDGKLVDAFQKEVGVSQGPDGKIVITSPGKDGILGNEDDVTSEMLKDLVGDKMDGAPSTGETPPAPAP